VRAAPGQALPRRHDVVGAGVASGRPSQQLGERSLRESLALILRCHGRALSTALGVVAICIVLGVVLKEIDAKYGELGATMIVALMAFGLVAFAVALLFPVLSLIGCVALAFSSSAATLQAHYGLPLLSKYLPMLLLCAIVLRWIRQSRSALVPRSLWLERGPADGFPIPFLLCLSLLAVGYAFLLISLIPATNTTLAFEDLHLQERRLVLCLAIALSVGLLGRWSSLSFLCIVALYATTTIILLAALGSFYPALEGVLPGFASVYAGGEPGEATDRIAGSFGHPNTLGRYAVFAMPLAICVALVGTGLHRVLALVCLLILVAGMTLSESRGAMLVLGIVALPALALTIWRVKVRYWLPGLVCAFAVVLAAWQQVDTERMTRTLEDAERMIVEGGTPSDGATRGRLSEMRIAYELWKLHPIGGIGLANYEHHFQMYSFDFGTKLYNDDRAAHSLYLEILAERGILGLLGFLLFVGGILLAALYHGAVLLRAGDKVGGYLLLALVVSAFTYYLSAMMLHDVHSQPIWALLGLITAGTRRPAPSAALDGRGHGAALRTRKNYR